MRDMDVVQQTTKTYDKIASQYCKKTRQAKFLQWEERYINKLLFYISTSTPLILDVGCGDGRHCALIEKNGGKAIGIDISKNMIAEAKSLYPNGDLRIMDMRTLLFEDGFFHGIWASGSIYHVPKVEVKQVFEEFRRVLKKDGVLALSFKLGRGEGLEANPKSYGGSPRYFAYYTHPEMVGLLENFGFKEIDTSLYPEEIFGDNIQQMWLKLENKRK